MKSGGPWNLRGLRPETLAAARDAARRSGVSVGEWLNELIELSADYGRAALGLAAEHDDAWVDEEGDDHRRGARPPRRDYDYDNHGRAPDSVLAREQLNDVQARLDQLTNQLERLVRDKPPLRGAPMRPSHRASPRQPSPRQSLQHHFGQPRSGQPQSWQNQSSRHQSRQYPFSPGSGDLAADGDVAKATDQPGDQPAEQTVSGRSREPDVPSPQIAPQLAEHTTEGERPPEFPELEVQLRRITAQIESLRSTDLDKVIVAFRSDLADIRRQLTEALPRQAVESLCVEVEALARRIDGSRGWAGESDTIKGIERGLAEIRGGLRGMTTAENLVGFDEALKALAQKLDLIIAREDPTALQQLETAIGALRGVVSHVASNDALGKVAEDVRQLAAKIDSLAKGAASGQAVAALGSRIDNLTDALNASAEVAAPRGLEKLLSGTMEKLESLRLAAADPAFRRLEERIGHLIGRLDASDARLGNLTTVERGVTDLLAQMEQLRGPETGLAAGSGARPAVAAIARDVAEIKRSEQRTQDSLEAVHGTVEQVIGRLAMIESDIHDSPLRGPRDQMPAQPPGENAQPAAAMPSQAGAPTAPAELVNAAERQDFIAAARRATQAATSSVSDDEVRSRSWQRRSRSSASGEMRANKPRLRKLLVAACIVLVTVSCLQIALHFFQDSRPGEALPWQHPAEPAPQPGNNDAAPPRTGSLPPPAGTIKPVAAAAAEPMPLTAPPAPAAAADAGPVKASATQNSEPAAEPAPPFVAPLPPPSAVPPAAAAAAIPQSIMPNAADSTGSVVPAMPAPVAAAPAAAPAPSSNNAVMNAQEPEALPATIGGPSLRAAAMAGDMAAQYEIGLRFGEGRGVPRNERQAAYWLDLAAKQGLAPAQFRLGGYYEKGIGVKKDLAAARELYLAAAVKGNAKAMHNLAVLYADGVNGRPDYHTAALWFRKAADHGITDSQFNLAILYAHGSGEPRNYAEAYKWFALAAKAGDTEAANKRDEIATQLDEEALTAADFVVKSWKPEPQPDEAIKVKAPPGGWDAATPSPKAKPRTKSANLAGPDLQTN
jgi:localization factor PodJL